MVIARHLRDDVETVDLAEDAHGQIRVQTHPFQLPRGQRRRLRPDLVGNPDPAQVVHMPGPAHDGHGLGVQARQARRIGGQLGDCARMPQCERAFQVDEVTERHQQRIQLRGAEAFGVVRGFPQRDRPGLARSGHRQHRRRVGGERVDDVGVELPAAPAAGHRDRPVEPVGAVVHLGHVGQLGHPHRHRDVVAAHPGGQATAVVALEGVAAHRLHLGAQAEPVGQHSGRGAMGVDQLGDLSARVGEKCCHDGQSVEQRLPAAGVGEQEP
ncbi:hypothetical protein ASJ79_10185 [Mycobacterium sp. NAZ190054]|nr:hypothetical protein ASJ79_10185 [Mycobacterium sp. NAZ190054]